MVEEITNQTPKLPFEKEGVIPSGKKRILYRSQEDYLFGGICGGLAKLWDVDATLVRLVFLLLTVLTSGLLLIAYLVMMKAIPMEPLD